MVNVERRKEERIKNEIKVTIERISGNVLPPDEKIRHYVTIDISLGGARVLSNTLFPIKAKLKVKLFLIEQLSLISAIGKVRWVRSLWASELFEMGLEFVKMSPDDIRILKKYIDNLKH